MDSHDRAAHAQASTSSGILIRRYAAQDWQSIAQVHDAARKHELALTVGIKAFRTLEDTAHDEGLFDGDLWVAEVGATIVGFVALACGEITWMYVEPAHFRHGVGRALLRYAIANCDCRNGPLNVSVLDGNAPALGLYLTEGFEIVETHNGHLQGMAEIPARGYVLRLGSRIDRGDASACPEATIVKRDALNH